MPNFFALKKITIFLLILAFLFGGFFVFGDSVSAWTEPTEEPPGGNVAAPINVSSTLQTKQGSLTIGTGTAGVLKLQPKTSDLATPCNEGELYYRQGSTLRYCDSARTWQPVGVTQDLSKYFKLAQDPPQESWGWLKGSANSYFALKGEAAAPTLHRSTGLEGWASDQFNVPPNPVYSSYGVVGYAKANVDSNYALVGTNYQNPSAWAGYFVGNVGIEKGAGIEARFTLKPGVKLCFDTDCKSSWSEVTGGTGSTYWNLSGYDLAPKDNAYSLAVGGQSGDDTNTVFYVNTAEKGSVVIGQPTDLPQQPPSLTLTCGDGACNGQEQGDKDIVANYCDPDCATVFSANPAATGVTQTSANVSWTAKESHWAKFEYGKGTSYELGAVSISGLPKTNPSVSLSSLTIDTTYYFRVIIWDEASLSEPRDTRLFTGSFKTAGGSGPVCGANGCETALGETCASCPTDCAGLQGSAAGCSAGSWCCGDGVCGECCSDANCSGDTPQCCGDKICRECCVDDDCSKHIEDHCCSGECQSCCSQTDCPDPYSCCFGECCEDCNDMNCIISGRDFLSLPLCYKSEDRNGQVLGFKTKLSQSLLIPEARAETDLFKNIIPVAEAAAPFDALANRKLSVYGGVVTIINGNASATHALEIGGVPNNNGMSISSTGNLSLNPSGNVGIGTSDPSQKLSVAGNFYVRGLSILRNDVYPQLILQDADDQMALGFSGNDFFYKRNNDNDGMLIYRRKDNTNIAAIDFANVRLGIANITGGNYAKLTVNNPNTSGKVGLSTDAIYAYANNLTGAAISAEQANAAGYAGYFSGKTVFMNGRVGIGTDSPDASRMLDVRASGGNTAVFGSSSDGYGVYGVSTTGSAIYGFSNNGLAGEFSGNVNMWDNLGVGGNLSIGGDIILSGQVKQTLDGNTTSYHDRIDSATLNCPAAMYVCGISVVGEGVGVDSHLVVRCCQ